MGNLDRANHDARKATPAPTPPNNVIVNHLDMLDVDLRERALALAIKAMKQGITPGQRWTDHTGVAIETAKVFYAFLKGDSK